MAQNLVPATCGLMGQTLVIGGTIINGIAVLYTISNVSTTMMDYVNTLPKIMENPSLSSNVGNPDTNNANGTGNQNFDIRSNIKQRLILFGKRTLIIAASITIGVIAKKVGTYLSSPEGITVISNFIGIK